jgi:hypothetical protein
MAELGLLDLLFTKPIYQAKPISLFVGKYAQYGMTTQGSTELQTACTHVEMLRRLASNKQFRFGSLHFLMQFHSH